MRITILAIGRCREPLINGLVRHYLARLPWPVEIKEIETGTNDPARRLEMEGQQLLKALGSDTIAVALDEHGQELTSPAFAARLGQWRDTGRQRIAFLIGGADGHAPEVTARADLRLAFGRMTWPHELVRVLLAEQLYRAHTILAGHPYHRG